MFDIDFEGINFFQAFKKNSSLFYIVISIVIDFSIEVQLEMPKIAATV